MTIRRIVLLILGFACLLFILIELSQQALTVKTEKAATSIALAATPGSATAEKDSIKTFHKWQEQQQLQSGQVNNWMETELEVGIQLARKRGEAMRELMRLDPDAALAAALSYTDYHTLPKEIQALVEEPFSGAGFLEVLISCGSEHQHHRNMHYRLESKTGESWKVFLPEHERVGLTKEDIPLQGIRLDGFAVIRGSVLQLLSGEDAAYASANWPSGHSSPGTSFATGLPVLGKGLIAISGGHVFRFQNESEVQKVESALREADQLPGRHVGSQWVLRRVSASGAFPFEQFSQEMQSAAYESTTGAKTALFILVDFPDIPGSPVNATSLEQVIDVDVSNALSDYSYGATTMDATVYAGPIRVNSNSSTYLNGGGNDDLYEEAIANYMTAIGTAVDPRTIYDTVGIYFTEIGYSWAGFATVGGQRMWIEDTLSNEVILHEFGHNYGLRHANYWVFDAGNGASTDPVDPTGASEEYGDDFDVMGDGSTTDGHFHMAAKQFLGWIENNEWEDLSSSTDNGTYRIYRFDDGNSNSGPQALRIDKSDTGDHYWVGYRHDYSGLPSFEKGAYLVWERAGEDTFRNQSWLIDTSPGSIDGKDDAPISIGRTYADSGSDIYITPIAVGGTTPDEYIDLVVNFGPFPGNVDPSGTISGSDTVDARQLVLFSSSVSDPDGDTLAYSWDMGDGMIKENSPSITHSWNSGGSYQIALTVSDMKGGMLTLTKNITVNDSLSTWTSRTSGTTLDLNSIAANDTHAVVVGDNNAILRSSDGTVWSDVSPPEFNNNSFNDVIWTGSEFIAVGQDYDFDINPEGWEGVIYTSPTGQTWTRAYETDEATTELNGIAYDDAATLIAVGESATILRKNGASAWTSVTSDVTATHILQDVAYGDGHFVFVGHATTPSFNGDVEVRNSTDGLTWADHSANTSLASWQDFREIEFVDGAFHASGFYGRARRSTNAGQNWSTTQIGDSYQIEGFAGIDGTLYAVGQNKNNADADIDLVSNDGINWTTTDPGAIEDRHELIAFNGTFISVGDAGSIRQSGTMAGSVGYDSYTATYFSGGGNDALEDSNPDFDWANNLIEYALGGIPDSNSDVPDQPVMYFDAADYAVFEITRDQKQQDVAYSVWWSPDLTTWTQAGLVVIEDTDTSLKVRTDQTFDQQNKAFFRLQLDR